LKLHIYPVAFLIAILSVGSITANSTAQGARGLPDPISSTELDAMLAAAGTDASARSLTVDPHERYLMAMATLREGEIEAWLEEKRESQDAMGASDTKVIQRRTVARRRLAMRIATLDRGLFADLIDAGLNQEAIERVRSARSRARSRTLAGRRFTNGIRFEPVEIYASITTDLNIAEEQDLVLDAKVLEILLAHDRLRTSRLAALANAAIELPYIRAEIMAESGQDHSDLQNATAEDMADWFAARERISREAAIEVRELQADIVRLDRSVMNQILNAFSGSEAPAFATTFRNAWLAAAHPSAFPDRESPVSLFEKAKTAHQEGSLPEEIYAQVTALEENWRTSHRALEDKLNEAIEDEIRAGSSGPSVEIGGVSIAINTDDRDRPRPDRPSTDIRQARVDLDRSTRMRLQAISPKLLANRVREGAVGDFMMGGGEGQEIMISAVMIGDTMGGEAIQIDAGDGMFAMNFASGGRTGIPRPIDRATFDALLQKLEVDDATRPIGDVLFIAYQDGWLEIEENLVAVYQEAQEPAFGPNGPVRIDPADIRRSASQRQEIFHAMDELDASLFRDLGTVIDAPEAIRSLMMQRRRTIAVESLPGGGGMFPGTGGNQIANLDLNEALEEVLAKPEWNDRIEQLSREYVEEITPAMVARTLGLIEVERDAQLAEQDMMAAFSEDIDRDGGVVRSTAIEFNDQSDFMRNLQAVERRRGAIEDGVADRQTSWRARLAASLPSNIEPEFQLQVDRQAWPRCFRDPRSPTAMFTTALGLPDLTEAQRSDVLKLRSDWTHAWTDVCRELIAIERDAAKPGLPMDGEFDMAAMQKQQSERKRVRFVRTEIDERAARKLLELLTPEQATAVGELPEAPTSNFPIEFGDLEMFIGG
jgi:hypothetical protein